MNLQDTLKNDLMSVVHELYKTDVVDFKIEHPANESFGDYASNIALILSKIINQSPLEIAKQVTSRLMTLRSEGSLLQEYSKIEAVHPGFINFTISDVWLKNILIEILRKRNSYGSDEIGIGKRVALEHSNVNPNKAAHVGHLRNACVGQFVERIYTLLGYKVEVQYYTNNVGVQVATSSMGIKKITGLSPTSYKKFDHYAWDVYSAMESMIESDPGLAEERTKVLVKLEDPTSPEFLSQKELADKILVEQLKTFHNLGIDYDVVIHESDIINLKMWEKAFELLKNNKNVYLSGEGASKGCWLVKMGAPNDLDTGGDDGNGGKASPPDGGREADSGATKEIKEVEKDKIIVRSNGIPTYTGKDIAYHMWKFGLLGLDFGYEKWDIGTQEKVLWATNSLGKKAVSGAHTKTEPYPDSPSFSGVDMVYDVIGSEQTYAMNAVKQALKYLGYEKQAEDMKHINYGFVYVSRQTAEKLGIDVSDGRKFYEMKGRKGWGVKIDDFIEVVDKKLKETYGDFKSVRAVRNGAIKLQMLKPNIYQDLVFDLDEALDLKGYTGPYIQYSYVRTRSINRKAGENICDPDDLKTLSDNYILSESEKSVLRLVYKFPEVVQKSAADFAPNIMSDFLFELAKKYNTFYNDESILNTPDKTQRDFRLALNTCVGLVLERGLWALGIEAPEQM